MKLFINNKRVKFIHESKSLKKSNFSNFISIKNGLGSEPLSGKILIYKSDNDSILSFLKLLETNLFANVTSINFLVEDVDKIENLIKKDYKIIKAAGGVVVKNDKLLMIYRLGNWDFPKGKLENDEKNDIAATREVYEECGVITKIKSKLCTTWHTYTDKDKKILKKTTWFLMDSWDDTAIKPQAEEGIEKLDWFSVEEANFNLKNSFLSLKYVFKKYKKSIKSTI